MDKDESSLSSQILGIFYHNPSLFISTMLVGNNIALVVYGLQMAVVLEPYIAQAVSNEALIVLIQSIISTLLILFAGEFIPKTIFKINPNFSLHRGCPAAFGTGHGGEDFSKRIRFLECPLARLHCSANRDRCLRHGCFDRGSENPFY